MMLPTLSNLTFTCSLRISLKKIEYTHDIEFITQIVRIPSVIS